MRGDEHCDNPTEVLFRDAEHRLEMAFNEALPALSRSCILWIDQSYRQHAYGSFHNQLKWQRILTRFWNDSSGSACIILELTALEPLETSWGIPLHWVTTTLTEPRILADTNARQKGNARLDEVMLGGLEQFMLQRIKREASRIGREL